MKHANKFLALILALAMVLSLGITAFAAAGDSVTSAITVPENDGHTYEAFQVLTATLTEDEKGEAIFSDVSWGKNANPGDVTVEAFMESIQGMSEKALRDAVEAVVDLTGDPAYTLEKGTTNVEPGYYIIRDTGVVGEDYTRTRYIVQVAGPLTITRKVDQPSSDKKVKDTNDSTGETSDWQDSADHDIGDAVSFKLTATVAADMADYKGPYALTFHDKQSDGLTFQADTVKAYVGNSETPIDASLYTVKTTGLTDGCTFEVHFADLKNIEGVEGGTQIRVEYTSELNKDAVIGSKGNPNTMHITYSNNPNDEQGGENGKTPDDTVIVFTFKTVINKVDQDGEKLAGAEFTLSKFNKNTNQYEEIKVITSTDNEPLTSFEFKGLDDGEYKLEETVTPAGYNTIDPIEFKITAEHDVLSENPALTSLNGEKVSGEITLTRDTDNQDALTAKIQNNKGTVLPSTGGIGTTIFYVVGSMMMLAAAVLLITRKKMSAYQD